MTVASTFPDERGPHGQPSRDDFKRYEYPQIKKLFQEHWTDLPLWQGQRAEYRRQDFVGRFGTYSVTGQLERDGSITLVEILIETFNTDGP